MANKLWFLLLILGGFAAIQLTLADKEYNLIFPNIRSAKVHQCSNAKLPICNLTISTRAARYFLPSVDLTNSTIGPIFRKDNAWMNNIEPEGQFSPDLMWDSKATFTAFGREFFVGIKESILYISKDDDLVTALFRQPTTDYALDHSLPVGAVATFTGREEGKVVVLYTFVFDIGGRLTVFQGNLMKGDDDVVIYQSGPQDLVRTIQLSALENPAHGKHSPGRIAIFKNTFLNEQLKKNLEVDLVKKAKTVYVQSITPMGPQSSAKDKETLCWSNGHGQGARVIECYNLGKNVTGDMLPALQQPDRVSSVVAHAHHRVDIGNVRHIHFAYTIRMQDIIDSRYVYCTSNLTDITSDGINLAEEADQTTNAMESLCRPIKMRWLPDDIIGFNHTMSDGKTCSKTIAFFKNQYIVREPNEPIHTNAEELNQYDTIKRRKNLTGLNFVINAAYAERDTLYLFTGVNTLYVVSARMENDCSELIVDWPSMKKMLSEVFLFSRAYNTVAKEPYFIDYREIAKGDNDTKPPLLNSGIPPDETVPGGGKPVGPDGQKQKGSMSVIIIAIGLILGGLIIAAIVYLFCLRGNNDDKPAALKRVKSRRSKTPPAQSGAGLTTDNISSMKTVRSEHGASKISSKVQSKLGQKSKSHMSSHKSKKSQAKAAPIPAQTQAPAPVQPQAPSTDPAAKSSAQISNLPSQGLKTQKSPKPQQSPRSPKSKSQRSRSPKSQKSPRSPKSQQSIKSHKSPKSPVHAKTVTKS